VGVPGVLPKEQPRVLKIAGGGKVVALRGDYKKVSEYNDEG